MTENTTPFIEDNDQTRARREHLEKIHTLTGNAYPNKFRRSNVTKSAEGEDTITAIINHAEITKRVPQTEAGARPSPEQLETANDALKQFGDVRVSGRLSVPPRVMGKAAFVHLSDGKERLQIYVRKDDARAVNNATGALIDEPESGWQLFHLLDHGDFVGVAGFLFVTKTGELSVHVRELQFLAKALLPMPDKLHGISDPEIRQRQRYADLIAGSLKIDRDEATTEDQPRELTTREVFERRSKIIREMRAFLDERGYIEVETPMLTPIASGAAARPFKTHHNALDIDLYARIAPELYLKRLLVGGFERVYELNRNFRNEGISTRHNPEFTMLEFYCAYMDVNGMMDLCEELLKTVAIRATGATKFRVEKAPRIPGTFIRRLDEIGISGTEVDFSNFKRKKMTEMISDSFLWSFALEKEDLNLVRKEREHWLDHPRNIALLHDFVSRIGIYTRRIEAVLYKEQSLNEETEDENTDIIYKLAWQNAIQTFSVQDNELSEEYIGSKIIYLFETLVEPELRHLKYPVFVTNFPKSISPLSKASPDDPAIAERFELYIAGMECANGFSELNDPLEQYERFKEQGEARERGDEEAMQMDTDYVRALAYGMPPAAGIGIGIDRIVMLLTNRRSIRDVILFPHMRSAARPAEEAQQPEIAAGQADDQA